MESVTEVPEEASGLRKPQFCIRVFLLLDRLPAKADEPCLPTKKHTHTETDRWDKRQVSKNSAYHHHHCKNGSRPIRLHFHTIIELNIYVYITIVNKN